jgi:hypothetical protein
MYQYPPDYYIPSEPAQISEARAKVKRLRAALDDNKFALAFAMTRTGANGAPMPAYPTLDDKRELWPLQRALEDAARSLSLARSSLEFVRGISGHTPDLAAYKAHRVAEREAEVASCAAEHARREGSLAAMKATHEEDRRLWAEERAAHYASAEALKAERERLSAELAALEGPVNEYLKLFGVIANAWVPGVGPVVIPGSEFSIVGEWLGFGQPHTVRLDTVRRPVYAGGGL